MEAEALEWDPLASVPTLHRIFQITPSSKLPKIELAELFQQHLGEAQAPANLLDVHSHDGWS